MSEAFGRVCDTLHNSGAKSTNVRQNRAMFQCPAHPDNNPSLEVIDKGDKVILACYAGCQNDDIIAALGLEWSDLFDGELERFATSSGQTLVRSYLYERGNGEPWFWVDRYYPKTFRQRLPDVEPVRSLSDKEDWKRLGLDGRAPIVYHLPRIKRALHRKKMHGDKVVLWWLDGEKDVETAEKHGLLATCPPGFRKWDPHYAEALREVDEIVMVVDQDKEKPDGSLGAGQVNAQTARAGFRSVGIKVRAVAPAFGKDLTDHFDANYGVDDFVPEPTIYTRPRGLKADVLQTHEFDEQVFAVNGLLPSGLCILAGSPKAGKTWVALDFSLAVAAGGRSLGAFDVTQGSVLHLAREDNYRRLQSRINLLMGGEQAPPRLELVPTEHDWPGGEEGLANMTEWAEEAGDPRLVVIDTIAKVEPEMGEDGRRGAYTGNYSMMARYKAWADTHNCAVLMIHHDNKTKVEEGGDPFTRISGTRGITGAADTLLFLETKRGTNGGTLHVTGRDVEEDSIEMVKSPSPIWQAMR